MPTSSIVTHSAAGDPIFGRERESARLNELVDGLPERGVALMVRGEAGIGKSALLAVASRRAEAARMQVLRTTGVQSEAQLPFAGLHQLVLSALDHADRPSTTMPRCRPRGLGRNAEQVLQGWIGRKPKRRWRAS